MLIPDSDPTPRLYVFLSVDIKDSTALKYGNSFEVNAWYDLFTDFYNKFPSKLNTWFKNCLPSFGISKEKEISIWKYAGDEILFYVEFIDVKELYAIIKSFEKTLNEWNSEQSYPIKLKGTIWLGQVPFIDRRLLDDSSDKIVDFVGSSIDCGFRIGKFSKLSGIVCSLEIVDLCISSNEFKFYYSKSERLKGVFGDIEYPIFYLKLSDDDIPAEKHLKSSFEKTIFETFINEFYGMLTSHGSDKRDYSSMVSRIGNDIGNYLKLKKKISKTIMKKNKLVTDESMLKEAPQRTSKKSDIDVDEIKKSFSMNDKE